MNIFIKYRTYFLVIGLTLILSLSAYLLFTPISNKWSGFILSNKEVRQIIKDRDNYQKSKEQWLDSANYYKSLAEKYEKSSDSSKIITIYIKQKTNEEVNNIPTLNMDSNVKQFPRDMEEYLSTK